MGVWGLIGSVVSVTVGLESVFWFVVGAAAVVLEGVSSVGKIK